MKKLREAIVNFFKPMALLVLSFIVYLLVHNNNRREAREEYEGIMKSLKSIFILILALCGLLPMSRKMYDNLKGGKNDKHSNHGKQ